MICLDARTLAPVAVLMFALLLSSCVGRGRYLESLLAQEAAKSDAASAKTDLTDADARYETLSREYRELSVKYDAQRQQAFAEQTGSLSERQQLLNTQTFQSLLIDSLTRDRKRLSTQRNAALQIFDAETERLELVQARVTTLAGTYLQAQMTMVRSDADLTLRIPHSALFEERRNSRLSIDGDYVLAALASALGGQPDLLVEVRVSPRDLAGTPAAREKAAQQALSIVSNLVEGHGLAPELVRATALQTDTGTITAAPAEFEVTTDVEIVIRRQGDRVAELKRALMRE